jgi:diacylglycerol O-acyltransferase
MPINLRSDDSGVGGNNWAPARFVVPLAVDGDVDDHLREMHDVVAAQRAEPALNYAESIATLMSRLPAAVLTQLFTSMLTCNDFVATNVPGVPFPLYLAGARIEGMDTFAPPSGSAVNVALLTYRDTASIALNIDPAAIPDPRVLLHCMRQGFDAVVDPLGTTGAKRSPRRRTAVS